jgi:medium-chain acyl-[acyl-carrier-protein] hydrolase
VETSKMGDNNSTRWLAHFIPRPGARLRLFCFPYAGGSALAFRGWQPQLPDSLEVCPVELPGRSARMREPPFTHLPSLVREIARAIRDHLDSPFAFFGHSMGSLICFELARHLRSESGVEPAHLFVSACRAPQIGDRSTPLHRLTDEELLEKLGQFNGTPQEVLNHPELMQMMLPLLRADFEMIETYVYSDAPPLGCPITAFGGLRDPEVGREHLEAWREQTAGAFSVRIFDGDHFFIHRLESLLLRELAHELRAPTGGEV